MRPHTKLALGAIVLAGAAAYLAYLGAATSWRYYVLVDECASSRTELVGQRLRVSGRVAAGSLALAADRSRRKGVDMNPDQVLGFALPGEEILQFGGKATTGRGRCRIVPL